MTRKMWKDGKDISWLHIVDLLQEHCTGLYRVCPKLTRAHINFGLFLCMKVNFAAQILSSTVATIVLLETMCQKKCHFQCQMIAYYDKRLSDYKISDGDKLFLFHKKRQMTFTTPDACAISAQNITWGKLENFLKRHFTHQDAEKVATEFKKDFYNRIDSLSLDDIERLAICHLLTRR
ncbi:ubiquitin-like protein 4A [Mytilus californianus]|uniref:ubiquitin-like protein 4A n=1 Tax=Mytilus californianus TaxID=6549 RepID=UPI002247DBE1|nr:ubiquitin-like protein 4A [Mytilus californianus]